MQRNSCVFFRIAGGSQFKNTFQNRIAFRIKIKKSYLTRTLRIAIIRAQTHQLIILLYIFIGTLSRPKRSYHDNNNISFVCLYSIKYCVVLRGGICQHRKSNVFFSYNLKMDLSNSRIFFLKCRLKISLLTQKCLTPTVFTSMLTIIFEYYTSFNYSGFIDDIWR